MCKDSSIDWGALTAPFPAEDIEWRVQRAGEKNGKPWAMVLAYVTNRAIQDRLDRVVGPDRWKNEFAPAPDGGVLCTIHLRVGDEWIGKCDGAENTDIEAVKGGLSNAMKRAAVQWGIGRYIRNIEATFVQLGDKGRYVCKPEKGGKTYRWDPPALPGWALPGASPQHQEAQKAPEAREETNDPGSGPSGANGAKRNQGGAKNSPRGNGASENQLECLRGYAQTETIPQAQRVKILELVSRGMSKGNAGKWITWCRKTVKETQARTEAARQQQDAEDHRYDDIPF